MDSGGESSVRVAGADHLRDGETPHQRHPTTSYLRFLLAPLPRSSRERVSRGEQGGRSKASVHDGGYEQCKVLPRAKYTNPHFVRFLAGLGTSVPRP